MENKITKIVLVLIMAISSINAFASNTSGEEELAVFANPGDVGADPGTSPINHFIIPMIVLGVALGYRLIITFQKKTV